MAITQIDCAIPSHKLNVHDGITGRYMSLALRGATIG